MNDYPETTISSMEYEALLTVDRMVRLCMDVEGTAGFLVSALQALDQVRTDQGLPIPEKFTAPPPPPETHKKLEVSPLAGALIKRVIDNE